VDPGSADAHVLASFETTSTRRALAGKGDLPAAELS
jgi:hypothetical protein